MEVGQRLPCDSKFSGFDLGGEENLLDNVRRRPYPGICDSLLPLRSFEGTQDALQNVLGEVAMSDKEGRTAWLET